MADPPVVTAMRQFKAQLLAREMLQMNRMADQWLGLERRLEAEILALVHQAKDEAARVGGFTPARLYRMQRYKRLLIQVRREFERYVDYAEDRIVGEQADLARLGLRHSQEAIQLSYWPTSIRAEFDRLPVEAVEYMVGLAGDGAPLGRLLRRRMITRGMPAQDVWQRLVNTLVQGTARGWNPRKTARGMRDDLAGGLDKALTIARTEELRVYREASRVQYEESGVVIGHKRLAAHDGRVCAACLAMDGERLDVGEAVYDHPKGRCTSVPVMREAPEPQWAIGEQWFVTQPEQVKMSVLGPERLRAWQAGDFAFADLARVTEDRTWGKSLTPTPLRDLLSQVARAA